MKHIKPYKLYTENPDAIPWEDANWKDETARPFWIVDGRAYIGEFGTNHSSMVEMYGLLEYEYSGRIWLEPKKLISFWNYPEPEDLYTVLKSLERTFRNVWDEDVQIIRNGFKIEIREGDMHHGNAIPLEDFIGSKHAQYQDWKEHIKSPMLKSPKKVPKMKNIPLDVRQKMYQENLNENTEEYKNSKFIIKNYNILNKPIDNKPIGTKYFNHTPTPESDIDYKNPKLNRMLTDLEKGHVNTMDWNQYITYMNNK